MKKIIISMVALSLGLISTAQVNQDFNSGSREAVRGNCWQMWGMDVLGGASALEGSHGARSSALSNAAGTYQVISPWADVVANTQVSFVYSKTSTSSSNVRIRVVAIAAGGAETVVWGPQPVNTGTQNGTFNNTLTGQYQFKFEFLTDGGGSTRGLLDNIVIPGTYASDITTNTNGDGNCAAMSVAPPDSDGDGIPDADDDYPNDASMAYNNYYPDPATKATLAFEDLWPSYGDYDFNDVIIDFSVNTITNANNDAVKLEMEVYVRAVGGSKDNGFGIQFDNLTAAQIASVTGYVHNGGISVDAKGLEQGQSKPVVIVYETVEDVINRPGGSLYNTIPANPQGTSSTVNIDIVLTSPVAVSSIGTIPYNPFIFVGGSRGHEIHMVNKEPTDLMDTSLFGQSNDDSDPAAGRYFKSKDNYCWALEVPTQFSYPIEQEDIVVTYLKFAEWAQSSGVTRNDWYQNLSGYRDATKVY